MKDFGKLSVSVGSGPPSVMAGQLSMVVSWPGDSSANLLREGIWGQFRLLYSIARRYSQVPQDSKRALATSYGLLVEWLNLVWSIN